MIRWKKRTDESKIEKPQPKHGDTKIKMIFLWWPFLHVDGEYYWLGFVYMQYIYTTQYTGIIYPITYMGWEKQRIISL
jgi:hypothetical protein